MEKNFKINWITSIAMAAFHAGFIFALFHITFPRIALMLCMLTITLCFGIGSSFHRYHTHQGYKTGKPVEYTLTVCGYLSLQGGLIWWVMLHRLHHKFTEMMGKDPHTPRDGKWWSHMDWMIRPNPEYRKKDLLKKWAPILCNDRFHVFLNDHAWLPITVFGLLVWLVSGWMAGSWMHGFETMSWAVFVPVTVGWHWTWLVNSATHLWGSRRFETNDDSRNTWWVAILTFGEGWHNNHHHDPMRVRHGIVWREIDVTWYFIKSLEFLRLVDHVKSGPTVSLPPRTT